VGIRLSFPRRIGNYDAQAVLEKAKSISELDLSEFRFMREYQQGLIAYGQDVIRSVAWGVSLALGQDPEQFEQAVQLPASDFKKSMEGGETTPLVKAVFSYLADKFGSIKKFYEKFKFGGHSDVEPMTVRGGPITNVETGEVLTSKRWQEIEDSIVGHLSKYLSGADEEMVVRAGLLQLLRERMGKEGIPVEEQKEMSYDNVVEKYGEQPRTWEEAEVPDDSVMRRTLEWARTRAGEYLAIDDGKLRTGIVNAVRKRLVDGIQNGDSPEEVARRLFYIDPSSEFDMAYSSDTIAAINRDWRRVAITETSFAMNNGFLAALLDQAETGEAVYSVFSGRYNPKEGADEPCNKWLGVTVRVLPRPPKGGSDRIDDPYAGFAVWPGKNTVGQKTGDSWIAIPVHPHCTHYWEHQFPEEGEVAERVGEAGTREERVVIKEASTDVALDLVKACYAIDPGIMASSGKQVLDLVKSRYDLYEIITSGSTELEKSIGPLWLQLEADLDTRLASFRKARATATTLEVTEEELETGILEVQVPGAVAQQCRWVQERIREQGIPLALMGFEDRPHITLLYGVPNELSSIGNANRVFSQVMPPVRATTGEIKYFDNPDATVCYLEVVSPQLEALHQTLKASDVPNKQDKPYHPHITIAYLAPGSRLQGIVPKQTPWEINTVYLNDRANDLRPITLGKPVGDMVLHPEFPSDPMDKSGMVPIQVQVNRMGLVHNAVRWVPLMKADLGFLVGKGSAGLVIRNRPMYEPPEPDPPEEVEKVEKAEEPHLPQPSRLRLLLQKARVWVKKTAKRKGHWRIDRRTKKVEEKKPRQKTDGFRVEPSLEGRSVTKKSLAIAKAGLDEVEGVFGGLGSAATNYGATVVVGSITGVKKANASYDPMEKVIMLDDKQGRNSLSHEIGHMVDQMFSVTGRILDAEVYRSFYKATARRRLSSAMQANLMNISIEEGPKRFRDELAKYYQLDPEWKTVRKEIEKKLPEGSSPEWEALWNYARDTQAVPDVPSIEEAGRPGVQYAKNIRRQSEVWARIFAQYFSYKMRGKEAKSAETYENMVAGTSYSDTRFEENARSAGYSYAVKHFMTDEEFQKAVPFIEACLQLTGFTLKALFGSLFDLLKAKRVWVKPTSKRKGHFRADPRSKKVEEKKEVAPKVNADQIINNLWTSAVSKGEWSDGGIARSIVAVGKQSPEAAQGILNNLPNVIDGLTDRANGAFPDRPTSQGGTGYVLGYGLGSELKDMAKAAAPLGLAEYRKQAPALVKKYGHNGYDLDVREVATMMDPSSSKEDIWYVAMGAWGSSTKKEASLVLQEATRDELMGGKGFIWHRGSTQDVSALQTDIAGLEARLHDAVDANDEVRIGKLSVVLSKLAEQLTHAKATRRDYVTPPENTEKLREVVREKYDATQTKLKTWKLQGVWKGDKLRLYRGVKEAIVTHNVAESWSLRETVAKTFDGHEIMYEEVDPSRVFVFYETDSKLLDNERLYNEGEFILLSEEPK
jgi:2'-5' RNA ligase